jgi:hypothetical protein
MPLYPEGFARELGGHVDDGSRLRDVVGEGRPRADAQLTQAQPPILAHPLEGFPDRPWIGGDRDQQAMEVIKLGSFVPVGLD